MCSMMGLALALAMLSGPAWCAPSPETPQPVRTVRLKRLAIGCRSFEALRRTVDVAVTSDRAAWLAAIEAEGDQCRPYEIVHGPIVDQSEDGYAVCVLGLTLPACLWFLSEDVEPARPL